MKNIDEIIKSANPKVPQINTDIVDNIMNAIYETNIKKPHFILKIFIIIFLTILNILIFNAILYEIYTSGYTEIITDEILYLKDFIINLPIDLIAIFLIIILLIFKTINQINIKNSYIKLSYAYMLIIFIISLSGTALANSNINENIQQKVINEEISIPVINEYYKYRARYKLHHNKNVLIANINELSTNTASIITPDGKQFIIPIDDKSKYKVGQLIKVKGKLSDDKKTFIPQKIFKMQNKKKKRYFLNHLNNIQKNHLNKPKTQLNNL